MKYKRITKDKILSLRLPTGWDVALREIASEKNKSLNTMLFELIDTTYRMQINTHLNKNRKVVYYENVEDMPFDPDR